MNSRTHLTTSINLKNKDSNHFNLQSFSITGYSTALFSTWFFIEELGLLFDAGDGLTSALLQKSRKIKHAFISHADRDHVTGLLQFHQLNAREGFPIIYYPADSGSFPALDAFTAKFDPHVTGTIWKPIRPNESFTIKAYFKVSTIRNNHIQAPEEQSKSLSFLVLSEKNKLKPQFRNKTGQELKEISLQYGKDHITEVITKKVLGYSGDTPVDNYSHWENTETLIHEATFLSRDVPATDFAKNKHSFLPEVIQMASELNLKQLVLSHFSSRYSKEQIDAEIQKQCKAYRLQIPVYRILPGELVRDILNQEPVYS